MITAIDTSVLLDLLLDDPRFGALSESALKSARLKGRLLVSEVVVAEIRPAFATEGDVSAFLGDIGIEFEPCAYETALLAGSMYARYLGNRGESKRVLPDFIVAAHSLQCADALLARDRGYYRQYFKDLVLIDPSIAR